MRWNEMKWDEMRVLNVLRALRVLRPRLSKDFKSQLSQVAKYRVRSDVRWTSMWRPQRETESRSVEWSEGCERCERTCCEDCGDCECDECQRWRSVEGVGPLWAQLAWLIHFLLYAQGTLNNAALGLLGSLSDECVPNSSHAQSVRNMFARLLWSLLHSFVTWAGMEWMALNQTCPLTMLTWHWTTLQGKRMQHRSVSLGWLVHGPSQVFSIVFLALEQWQIWKFTKVHLQLMTCYGGLAGRTAPASVVVALSVARECLDEISFLLHHGFSVYLDSDGFHVYSPLLHFVL